MPGFQAPPPVAGPRAASTRAYGQATLLVRRGAGLATADAAAVTAYLPGTTAPYPDPLYGDPDTLTPLAFPVATGADGVVALWADAPGRLELYATGAGLGAGRVVLDLEPPPSPDAAAAGAYTKTESDLRFVGATNDLFDVTAYGAVPDGTTDATAAYDTAHAAATAAGGGIVYFPPGTYLVGPLRLSSGVRLRGAGMRATTLVLKNGSNLHVIGAYLTGQTDCAVSDLTLDGNGANQSGGITAGIGFSDFVRPVVERVRITNTRSQGIFFHQAQGGRITDCELDTIGVLPATQDTTQAGILLLGSVQVLVQGNRLKTIRDSGIAGGAAGTADLRILDNHIEGSTHLGIALGSGGIGATVVGNVVTDSLTGIDPGSWEDVTVVGNVVRHCNHGITPDTGKRLVLTGNTVVGCRIEGTSLGSGGGISLASNGTVPWHAVITGNTVHDCDRWGIALDGVLDAVVDGNEVSDCSGAGVGLYDGIQLLASNPLSHVRVTNNHVVDHRATPRMRHGVSVPAGATAIVVADNLVRGATGTEVEDAGTGTVLRYYTAGTGGYLPLTGGSLSGNLSLNGTYPQVAVDAPADHFRSYRWKTSGSDRWALQVQGVETGGDASSDLAVARFGDDGGYLGNALVLTRATGKATFGGDVVAGNLAPDVNGVRDLGTTAARWGKVHAYDLAAGSVTSFGELILESAAGSNMQIKTAAILYPTADNLTNLGWSTNRWTVVYATAGAINTSSLKAKDPQGDLDPAAALAAVLRTPARRFKYKGTERVQSGYYLEEADPLFTIGPDQASATNDTGILLAAIQALAAQVAELKARPSA